MPTTSLGIQTPNGSDRVAIAADLQAMANETNQAILDQFAVAIGATVATAGASLDSFAEPQKLVVLSGNSNLNTPAGEGSGVLQVDKLTSTSSSQLWRTFTTGRLFHRFKGSTGWSDWTRIDGGIGIESPRMAAGVDLNDVVTDSKFMAYVADGHGNMPEDQSGFLTTKVGVGASKLQTFETVGGTRAVYSRFAGSGGWSSWVQVDGYSALAAAKAYADSLAGSSVSAATLRSGAVALTVGGSDAAYGALSRGVRMPMRFAPTVTRFRVHVRNINPRFAVPQTGAVSVSGMWFGAGDGSGNFSGTPSPVSGAFSTPSNGDEWVSDWVNGPVGGGSNFLLAYGFTATAATKAVVGGGWTVVSPSDATNNAAAKTAASTLPLDVWLECETAASVPRVAWVGDSLSSGVGATLPVNDAVGAQYARQIGALPVLYAASGDGLARVKNPDALTWTRWVGVGRADVAVLAMGSNDIFNGDSLATVQANWLATLDNVKRYVSSAVVATTIMPRDGVTGAAETVRRQFNTWLKSLPGGIRDVFDIVPAVSSDDETLNSGLTVDGIHLTTAGYALNRDAITRTLVSLPSAGIPGPPGVVSDASLADAIASGSATGSAFNTKGDARYRRKGVVEVNAIDYAGVDRTGATDSTTGLQNAEADAYAIGGDTTLVIPYGTYTITGTVKFRVPVDATQATFNYTGTGTAVVVGDESTTGVITIRKAFRLPKIVCMNAGNWDGSSVGLRLVNLNSCNVYIPHVKSFESNVVVYGKGGGCAYNTVTLGHILQGHKQFTFTNDATGYVNQNNFVGGRVEIVNSKGATADDPGCMFVYMQQNGSNSGPNNNTFVGTSFEGDNFAQYRFVFDNARYNRFVNCRYECIGGATSFPILYRNSSTSNFIDGGYDAWKIVETFENSSSTGGKIVDGVGGKVKATLASQPVPNNTLTPITAWSPSGATRIAYNATTGEFTPRAGRWLITAQVTFASTGTGAQRTHLVFNGSTEQIVRGAGSGQTMTVSAILQFNGFQTFKINALHTAGSTLDFDTATGYCVLRAEYLPAN